MEMTSFPGRLRKFEIPGRVTFANGNSGLLKINVTTGRSTAEIYLHGAHITGFQKNGEPPLLFMSRLSQFAAGKADSRRRAHLFSVVWPARRRWGARIRTDHGMGIGCNHRHTRRRCGASLPPAADSPWEPSGRRSTRNLPSPSRIN